MAGNGVFLTRDGYERLRTEMEQLMRVKRKKISKQIATAREFGDLKENAEYHAAKEAQAMNEKKIADLQDKLSQARMLDDEDIAKDQVFIGATVTLKDTASGDEIIYTLVSAVEADFSAGRISVSSPVGKALLGHKVKDLVEINVPAGILKYEVLKITR